MAAPLRIPDVPPAALAWAGAAAGVVAALLAVPDRPVLAVLALGAAAASAWLALRGVGGVDTAAAARPESALRPKGLPDIAPLLEAMPDPAIVVDADGRVGAANQAARRKFGFDAVGGRLSAIMRQPDLLDAADAAAREGASVTLEYETAGQVEEHVRCYVAPVQWGELRAALIVFHDQTARIASERLRADFLANASHELRTPLAALMVLIETIAGPARDNAQDRAKFLGMMQTQAERMRRLIDDLLSLSRIELDEHVPPSDRADLAAVAREVVDALAGVAAEREVTLHFEEPAAPAYVVGHRFQLVQVVQNLVDNAVKYTPDGGAVVIEVGVADSAEDVVERAGRRWSDAGRIALLTPAPAAGRSYAFVRVTDSGPGIARRFLPKLGARFFRVEREMGDERGGTGLGLAIVKHIVNRHRGGLLVESAPGRGSAFAAYVERAQ